MPQRRSARSSSRGQVAWPAFTLILLVLVAVSCYEIWRGGQRPAAPGPAGQAPAGPARTVTRPAALPSLAALPTLTPGIPTATIPAAEVIRAWFSDPLSGQKSGGPDLNLARAIDGAQKSIDMAIYNLTSDEIGNAMLNAKNRGVQVRVVMESEAMDKSLPRRLIQNGIPIIGDQREGLMHNKFTIIDGQQVWTGSLNYTRASAYEDFNNLVRIVSPQVALDYQANFDEMFLDHKFGPDKQPNTPYPRVTVGGIPVEIYFSPDDGVAKHVTAELQKARTSIHFLAYSFTSNDFARAMQERAKAGVQVRGVFDESQVESNIGGEYDRLRRAGIDVRLDGIPGLLHDKVMIIDSQVVITGSYNFSANAENTNDENLVIIRDPNLAAQFEKHFQEVYGEAKK